MIRAAHWIGVLAITAISTIALADAPPATADIALDPAASGIKAVNDADALLRAQNPDAAIAFFTDVLNQTRNSAVERAIRFRLVELYKQTGRPDKAIEVLKDLILATPPVPPPTVVQLLPAEATGTGAAPAAAQP